MMAWLISSDWLIWPMVLVVCTGFDAIFCGLETGIYVMNKNRLELRAEAGNHTARTLQRMLARPNRLLTVLLIGANVCRYLSTFSISAMFVQAGHEAGAEVYTLLVATPLFFVVSDSGPKSIFQRLGARGVYPLVWLLKAADRLFFWTGISPLVMGVSTLLMRVVSSGGKTTPSMGHQGIATLVEEGYASGVLTHFQSVMADRVMRIGDVQVGDVMIPMERVVSAPQNIGRDDLIEIIRPHNFSRLPMLDHAGQAAGVLNIYDVLGELPAGRPADKSTPPLVLPVETTVTDALYRMRRSHQAMAVAALEGRHVGIVTIKDLVEEIVGELEAW